jgi:hypothetical protein
VIDTELFTFSKISKSLFTESRKFLRPGMFSLRNHGLSSDASPVTSTETDESKIGGLSGKGSKFTTDV